MLKKVKVTDAHTLEISFAYWDFLRFFLKCLIWHIQKIKMFLHRVQIQLLELCCSNNPYAVTNVLDMEGLVLSLLLSYEFFFFILERGMFYS